jgi:hypothetical protein
MDALRTSDTKGGGHKRRSGGSGKDDCAKELHGEI